MELRVREIIRRETGLDITEKCRREEYVELRALYYTVLKEMGYSYCRIARTVGKQHGTVIHGLNHYKNINSSKINKLEQLIIKELL
ncbi:hypothetical protein [Flavobacterium sp.]|uniref:hypothetical protein n=1 Tax=Flavobacterium sp. TaxID=239 RepID=UPI0025E708E9|nr:hypothetical protein [Flavobacterium sp.]